MSDAQLIELLQKKEKTAQKLVFDRFYGKLAAIAPRYAKSQAQADELLNTALNKCLANLSQLKDPASVNLDKFFESEFIKECIAFIRNIRSEYYVSSTVYATETPTKNYDLFENNDITDFSKADNDTVLKALQQLVPAQRLIFNLHVIDGYKLDEAAALLEASEPTVKSNLEKARYNMQKNIEKSLKNTKS